MADLEKTEKKKVVGKTSHRLDDPSMQDYKFPNNECCFSGLIDCCCIYTTMKRTEVRKRFGIKGSGFKDYCQTCWCLCCALHQQDQEVQARLGTGTALDTEGYRPTTEGMTMPAQQ